MTASLQQLSRTDAQIEAMTAERPYRPAMPVEQALGLMRGDMGSKLCPEAFDALAGALRTGALTFDAT